MVSLLCPTTGPASEVDGAAAIPLSEVVTGVVADGGLSLSMIRGRGKVMGRTLLVGVAVSVLESVILELESMWSLAGVVCDGASAAAGASGVALTVESEPCVGLGGSVSDAVVL